MKKILGAAAAMALLAMPAFSRASAMKEYWVDVSADEAGQASAASTDLSFMFNPNSTGPATYDLVTTPTPLIFNGVTEGILNELDITVDSDPAVHLGFNVTSESSSTVFTISSPVMAISPVNNPQASATAAVTLTDDTDAQTGGSFTAENSAGKAYEADYNSGTPFADLLSSFAGTPGSSQLENDRSPAAGTTLIPGTVSSIYSSFNFQLSPDQGASGTSNFNLSGGTSIPEPASVGLALVASSLGLLRRRRKI